VRTKKADSLVAIGLSYSSLRSYASELVAATTATAASAAIVTAASTSTTTAGATFLCLEAIATEDWAIASGFEGNRGLLSAA
jgi:hypothetical protein